jgi:hypothetical protein
VLRLLVTADFPSSPIFVILMLEAIRSSEVSVLTRVTPRNIPEDCIPHSQRRKTSNFTILFVSNSDFTEDHRQLFGVWSSVWKCLEFSSLAIMDYAFRLSYRQCLMYCKGTKARVYFNSRKKIWWRSLVPFKCSFRAEPTGWLLIATVRVAYDTRQIQSYLSAGQSLLVSGHHLGHVTNFAFTFTDIIFRNLLF